MFLVRKILNIIHIAASASRIASEQQLLDRRLLLQRELQKVIRRVIFLGYAELLLIYANMSGYPR